MPIGSFVGHRGARPSGFPLLSARAMSRALLDEVALRRSLTPAESTHALQWLHGACDSCRHASHCAVRGEHGKEAMLLVSRFFLALSAPGRFGSVKMVSHRLLDLMSVSCSGDSEAEWLPLPLMAAAP